MSSEPSTGSGCASGANANGDSTAALVSSEPSPVDSAPAGAAATTHIATMATTALANERRRFDISCLLEVDTGNGDPRTSDGVGSAVVHVGIHLPQFGRASSPDAITEAARLAESLGFADVWVSDHIAIPAAQDYPSPYLYDPLLTLTWAAAATERVGLGTSVLVVPQHNPLALANALASLDALSRRPPHDRRGRRLVGGRVRRARSVVRRPRPAHGRDARRAARVLGTRSRRLPRRVRAPRRDEGAAEARAPHPDLGRRSERTRVPTGSGAGRRLPRHRSRSRGRGACRRADAA